MAEKMSPEISCSKRTSVKSYASTVFQESSVGMVSSVASTRSMPRKVFKMLALVFCLTGFLYQSAEFLTVVFQYPTTVDIDVQRSDVFIAPAYTFCNDNGINRKIFCDKYPDRCEEPSEAFCKKYGRYCGENNTLVPKKEYYNYLQNISFKSEDLIDLNVDLKDTVSPGENSEEEITGPHFRERGDSEPAFMCYTFNDRVNNNLYPKNKTIDIIFKNPIDEFTFKIHEDETFLPGSRAGILFSLHSPFQAVNPFKNGIFMKPGRTYLIYISMEEEVLQKRPYDTDCTNYIDLWEKNGLTGPRMQEMCYHKCLSEALFQCFNCIFPTFLFPIQGRICSIRDALGALSVDDSCLEKAEERAEQCSLNCKDDCRKTKYRYNVQERFGAHFDSSGDLIADIESTIEVKIYVEEDEVMVYKHNPKYMFVEVFSTIGGFIGIWLGISLLDVTDIFEGFFRIFRYSYRQR